MTLGQLVNLEQENSVASIARCWRRSSEYDRDPLRRAVILDMIRDDLRELETEARLEPRRTEISGEEIGKSISKT